MLSVFCWRKQAPSLGKTWASVTVSITSQEEEYKVYQGSSPGDVQIEATIDSVFWFLTPQPRRLIVPDTVQLSPFHNSCVGILSDHDYIVSSSYDYYDPWSIFLTLLGLTIINRSNQLSSSTPVAVSFKILLSAIFSSIFLSGVVVLTKKTLTPKSLPSTIFCSIATSIQVMFWIQLYYNDGLYSSFALGVIVALGVFSFMTTDRLHRPLVERLVKITGYFIVWMSSYNWFASSLLVVSIMLAMGAMEPKYQRTDTPRLLDRSLSTTEKALEELRNYCLSSDLNVWKMVTTLRDPTHFARFINKTVDHVSKDEIMEHQAGSEEDLMISRTCETEGKGHRFTCLFCQTNNFLGHRFKCSKCFIDP